MRLSPSVLMVLPSSACVHAAPQAKACTAEEALARAAARLYGPRPPAAHAHARKSPSNPVPAKCTSANIKEAAAAAGGHKGRMQGTGVGNPLQLQQRHVTDCYTYTWCSACSTPLAAAAGSVCTMFTTAPWFLCMYARACLCRC